MVKKYIGDRAFYKKLFEIMIPILIQNIITNFVALLDNIMVGQIGTEPMSGVAIVNQLMFVFNLCIFGGMAGAGILTAQYFGKGDFEGVRNTFRAKLWIAFASLAAFMAVFALWGEVLISLFIHQGTDDLDLAATLVYGKKYLRIMLFQMPFFTLLNVYSSTLRETGETVLPMKAGIAAVFANLILNYILIYGKLGAPALGVEGAAIATIIARILECMTVVLTTHKHAGRNPFIIGAYRTLRVPSALLREVAVLGLPLLVNEFLWSSGMTTLNQVMSLRGLEAVSAENICSTVSDLFFCSFLAMGNATAIIVGQLLGAGETERAIDEDRKLIAFSVVFCAAVGIIMALASPYIPMIYNTTDTVKYLAAIMILVNAVMMPSSAFTNACYFTLRSGGRVWITFLFDSVYIWVLSIPLSLSLVKLTALSIIPIYAITYGTDIVKCIIGYILVKKKVWVNNLVSAPAK